MRKLETKCGSVLHGAVTIIFLLLPAAARRPWPAAEVWKCICRDISAESTENGAKAISGVEKEILFVKSLGKTLDNLRCRRLKNVCCAMRRTVCVLLAFDVLSVLAVFDTWRTSSWAFRKSVEDSDYKGGYKDKYDEGVSLTGRVLVTMFGYPSRCQHSGYSHSCTLSLACWLVGGISETGCGGNPWLVACCVKKGLSQAENVYYQDFGEHFQRLEPKEGGQFLQRRNDEVEDECGLSSDRVILKRIIGGTEAKFAQFPWQAHLKISAFQCGGVLVTRRFIATAAHCIIRARLRDITAYLGELDTQDTGKVEEFAPAELHRIRRKIVHPSFQFRLTQPDRYDLALLELVTEAGVSFHIVPICLPNHDMNMTGRKGVVAGWGKIKPSTELMGTNILRSATVPILDIKECMKWHQNKQIIVELHEEMLCAGHEDGHQDACLGDSGGPLIVLENGRWTLAGITSAGFGCGEPHQPGIYHSIPVTVDWIRSVVYS